LPGIFDVGQVPDVPRPDQHAVLLSARCDLDLATSDAARSELLDAGVRYRRHLVEVLVRRTLEGAC
jgi:hypothetical protein